MKTLIIVGLIVIILALMDVPSFLNQQDYQYSDMSAFLHPNKDVCIATELGFEIKVEFVDEWESEGSWNPYTMTIVLKDKSVDTVAHEVHHMTEDMIKKLRIKDTHMPAYMQGFFTQCVYAMALRHELSP